MFTDQLEHPVTAGDARSVEAYDRALRSQLRIADDLPDAWEATVAVEPDFAMGHIGRAYLRCLSSESRDAAQRYRGLEPGRYRRGASNLAGSGCLA